MNTDRHANVGAALPPPRAWLLRALNALIVTFAVSLYAPTARADTLVGMVVGVSDGDTITILDGARALHRVRLAGIDAPETSQPFSHRAKEQLSSLVYERHVSVDWHKLDRYGRRVGKVVVDGLDVCREMVAAGLAWHYKAYENEQSAEDRAEYARAEAAARDARRGLWHDPDPVPPWEFRAWRRTNPAATMPP